MNIFILGSTGSVGRQTLDVIDASRDQHHVYALGGGSNIQLLAEQIDKYKPRFATVADEVFALQLKRLISVDCTILWGADNESMIASLPEVDTVVVASSSLHPLPALYAACLAGKKIAISNKETIVACGDIILDTAARHHATIIPVDSEHNAIFQCLKGEEHGSISQLLLTASGGAFRDLDRHELEKVTAEQALAHPNWRMGAKITIDCATLVNKGLEIIEAMRLFDMPSERIGVVVHRESIIHSMVRFTDGSVKALLAVPDMRLPIQFALDYPHRRARMVDDLDFSTLSALHFDMPDTERFPCLALAIEAAKTGGAAPLALTSADDVCVQAFQRNKIGFYGIHYYIASALDHFADRRITDLDSVYALDAEIKRYTRQMIYGANSEG